MKSTDDNVLSVDDGFPLLEYLLLFPTDVSEGYVLQETGNYILNEDGSGGKLLVEA